MAASLPVSKDKGASPELYLEVRNGETPVDPARWLGGTTAQHGARTGGR